MMIAVLNGVNLNLLGRRDPALYGTLTLPQLESQIYEWAGALRCRVRCFQSNHEGEYIENIHDSEGWAGGVIVNPGAWTHYAYAVRDALDFLAVPVVEVHLSNIGEREEWRRRSVIADVVDHRITGHGPDGYREAIEWLAERGGARGA
jgi:3-dehydroquinate dehydratase-2